MGRDGARPAVRITNQFRKRQAMVYDLSCNEVRLTLEMTSHETGEGVDGWRIEAFARQAPERPTIDETGTTRRDALLSVARTWVAKKGILGFPVLDWEAVAEVLGAVRAI
jgi:hypothetical protein